MRVKLIPILALLLLVWVNPASADWSANFQPPLADQPALLIDLPDNLDSTTLSMLAVELNGIDITALLSFEQGDFIYTPVEVLAAGSHLIRLLILQADGTSSEKAQWFFTVAAQLAEVNSDVARQTQAANAEKWIKSASFSADTLTEFSTRIRSRNIGVGPKHSIVSGAGNVYGQLQGSNWEVNAQGNYLVQTDHDLALTGNPVDVGEYTLTADYGGNQFNTGVTLGHHDVGLDSLLFSAFHRRGISGRLASQGGKLAANIFAFRPEPQVGASNFTGLSQTANRLDGFSTTLKPFSAENDALKITAMYYDGERELEGIGISDPEEISTGSGWGIMLEKSLVGGRINMRGEYANSRYDLDGALGLIDEEDSDAVSFLIETRPFNNPSLLGKPIDIVVGAKYDRIDTYFQSLANENLAADRDAILAYSNIAWGNLTAELQWNRETNNVDNLRGMATDELEYFLWNTNYTFATQTGSRAWLGSPYLNFSGFVSGTDRDKTPDGYAGFGTDNRSKSFTLGGGANYASLYWTASHTYAEFSDRINTAIDTISNFSSLGLGWRIVDRLELTSGLQYGAFEDTDNDATTYNTNLTLGLIASLIPRKLNFNLNYNLNMANDNGSSLDKHIVNSELGWTFKQATNNHPGFTLALRGSMENTNGNTISITDETGYQIFALFRVTAPIVTGY